MARERSRSLNPRELVVLHNGGFFSCCTIRLREIIRHYNVCRVLPTVDSSAQFKHYKTAEEQAAGVDLTPHFFTTGDETRAFRHVEFSDDQREDQYSDFDAIHHEEVGFFVRRYFTPSSEVLAEQAEIQRRYDIDPASTIVVLYRGNDKRREMAVPDHDRMLRVAAKVAAAHPRHRVLVQTDELEFCHAALDRLPNSFALPETVKIPRQDSAVQYVLPPEERRPHAITFLAVLHLIAQCDQIVLNRGNVGLWACLYRGHTHGVRQVGAAPNRSRA
jgi:hypothetical protein